MLSKSWDSAPTSHARGGTLHVIGAFDLTWQQTELSKTQNKMLQLEKSLQLSSKRYEKASEEIKRLRARIQKGITPQIEGLLEEKTLLPKLQELFPADRFEHPGKKGDILQHVQGQGKTVGVILYECKKVRTFSKSHVLQAKKAKVARNADYAVLVTNAFPAKKQHYFVEKDVFVISPVSLEPIAYTLRDSLLRMAVLKLSAQAKEKAVQAISDYLGGTEYRDTVAGMADQLVDLGGQLKAEMRAHRLQPAGSHAVSRTCRTFGNRCGGKRASPFRL